MLKAKDIARKLILLSFCVCVGLVCVDQTMRAVGRRQAEYEKTHLESGVIKPVKVFQIGFNKCGTLTLATFFSNNNVPAIHHGEGGKLPLSIYQNHQKGAPLLSPEFAQFSVFTDMDLLQHSPPISVGMQYFKELDKQYPGSKFILNTRNREAWLKSRVRQGVAPSGESMLTISARINGLSTEQMLARWSLEWDTHHQQVLEYFKDRPDDLLVFNIETDPPAKLVDFFKDYFKLDARVYKKMNETPRGSRRKG